MAAKIPSPKYSALSGHANAKHLPRPYKLRRYYTPAEVALHNCADDIWVSFFNRVYDLTNLVQENYSELCEPIIKAAGTDITHWFDPATAEVRPLIVRFLLTLIFPLAAYAHRPCHEQEGYILSSRAVSPCTPD